LGCHCISLVDLRDENEINLTEELLCSLLFNPAKTVELSIPLTIRAVRGVEMSCSKRVVNVERAIVGATITALSVELLILKNSILFFLVG
jgi:hypothetical protein